MGFGAKWVENHSPTLGILHQGPSVKSDKFFRNAYFLQKSRNFL